MSGSGRIRGLPDPGQPGFSDAQTPLLLPIVGPAALGWRVSHDCKTLLVPTPSPQFWVGGDVCGARTVAGCVLRGQCSRSRSDRQVWPKSLLSTPNSAHAHPVSSPCGQERWRGSLGAIMGTAGPQGWVTGGCRGWGREKRVGWELSRDCGMSEQHPL